MTDYTPFPVIDLFGQPARTRPTHGWAAADHLRRGARCALYPY